MPELHNPQQDPGTERRLLIAFALTFAVLLISQPLLMKFVKPPQAPAKQEQQQPANQQASQPAATPPPMAAAVVGEDDARDTVFDHRLLLRGGLLGGRGR